MLDAYPKTDKYISKSTKCNMEELRLRPNTLLLTRSGTIGNISLVIIRLAPWDDIAGYVYIWLQTVYANVILKSFSYGSVVSHIEKEHFYHTSVPLLKDKNAQMQINNLALQANRKRYEAYQLEQQAIEIMEREVICREKL